VPKAAAKHLATAGPSPAAGPRQQTRHPRGHALAIGAIEAGCDPIEARRPFRVPARSAPSSAPLVVSAMSCTAAGAGWKDQHQASQEDLIELRGTCWAAVEA